MGLGVSVLRFGLGFEGFWGVLTVGFTVSGVSGRVCEGFRESGSLGGAGGLGGGSWGCRGPVER